MLRFQTEVSTFLQSSGVGTVGYTIFEGTLPDSPLAAVGVFCIGGAIDPIQPLEMRRMNLQILCRGTSYFLAASKAEQVYSVVAGKWNALSTIEGQLSPDHQVGPHYLDENNRFVFTLNFNILTIATTV